MPPNYEVPIEQLISRPILTCKPDTAISEAARRMAEQRCGAIVVMQEDQAVGIWTERDALTFDPSAPDARSRPVQELMSQPVRTLHGRVPVGDAAIHFKRAGVRHFLVVDDEADMLRLLSLPQHRAG